MPLSQPETVVREKEATKCFKFDFSEPPHPVMQKIDVQYQALRNMITVISEYTQKQQQDIKRKRQHAEARITTQSNGDEYLYQKLYYEELEILDILYEEYCTIENTFLHAAFCIVYSFFETSVCLIANPTKITEKPYKEELQSEEAKADYDYIVNEIRLIRHMLIHNYNNSALPDHRIQQQKEVANKETQKNIGFIYTEQNQGKDDIFLFTKDYIQLILEKEYNLLVELINIHLKKQQ